MNSAAAAAVSPSFDLVSKGEFARRRNVSPGRVSQWIAEGKISGEALEGEGRNARIRESVAIAQLNRKLDIVQRTGNGLSTRLTPVEPPLPLPAPAAPETAPAAAGTPVEPPADPVEEQIKRARLEQLRAANRRTAEEEAARAGLLVNAEVAAQQFGKIAVQLVTVFDGALASFAAAISAKFELPQRDVLHLLRGEFRKVRADASAAVRRAAEGLPVTVEQKLMGEDDERADE